MKLRGLVPYSYINVWGIYTFRLFCRSKIVGPIVYSIHDFRLLQKLYWEHKNLLEFIFKCGNWVGQATAVGTKSWKRGRGGEGGHWEIKKEETRASGKLLLVNAVIVLHCKWRAGENPVQMYGSHLCTPRNESVQPPYKEHHNSVLEIYFQNIIMMFCLPIPALIYLWERDLYISRISLSILLQPNMWTDPGNI